MYGKLVRGTFCALSREKAESVILDDSGLPLTEIVNEAQV